MKTPPEKFIMTFGQDFIFIGNQYRIEVAGEELFIDSKEPDFEKYHEFLNGEVRYNSLVLKCDYINKMFR